MLADTSSKFVRSSLHSILAAGIQSSDSFQIANPDYQTKGDIEILKGDQAYLKVVSQSLVGSGYAPTSVMNPLLESVNGKWPGNDKSQVGDSTGVIFTHDNIRYTIDSAAPSLGEKAVALEEELSDEEKKIYLDRGALLKKFINEPALTLGFQFDIPNVLSGYSFVQTNSHYTEQHTTADTSVQSELISSDRKLAYVSAALIECLLMLTDVSKGVKVNGTFALNRAVLSENDKTNRYSNPENGIDKNHKNSISDHVFGRAFDIKEVAEYSSIGGSKENYAMVLDMVLQKLDAMPLPLVPDLIIIHPDVAKDKGIGEGYESIDTAIKKQYNNLRYVNFEFGPEHTNNIHISFSPQRGGRYIASTGAGWTTKDASSQAVDSNGVPIDNEAVASTAKAKAYTNYRNGGPTIGLYELFVLLSELGPFSHEAAAILCAIAGRESGAHPDAYNGACSETSKSWGGDVSIGMFQYNLISLITKSNNTAKSVPIYYSGSSNSQELIPAHRLMYTIPEASTWDPNAVAKTLVVLYNIEKNKEETKSTTDERLWYPINQIWMLMDKWGRTDFKNVTKINTSNGFYHWGDYPKDVEPENSRSECGFIFETKFQNAVNVYLTTGKPIETLHEWVRKNLKAYNPRTVPYIEEWMQGKVFYDKKKNNTLINESSSGIINYETGVVSAQGAGDGGESATFTKSQIKEAADWISVHKIPQWLAKYRSDLGENFQCDRFARVLSAALGLFGTAQMGLFTDEWLSSGSGDSATVATPSLVQFNSAGEHLSNLISSEYFHKAGTEIATNPPAGYLVFWTGGDKDYGHDGISIGNGQYVDQHSESEGSERIRPRSISSTTFPGSGYTYAGTSSKWSV